MTNNQLNRERLEKIKSWRETYGAGSNVMLPAEEAEVLARIALAAMFQAKSLTGNSPVIGIDLASGPDRTVEVHYVAPPGYVMVPKEPTEAMMLHNSGCQHHAWDDPDCAMRQTRRLIWSHMLAAAPQEVK